VAVIGITGGIATGKSTFTEVLFSFFPEAHRFSADAEVSRLTAEDAEVRREIRILFGDSVFLPDGEIDRRVVREGIFGNAELRKRLEAILHPRVREAWVSLARSFRKSGRWLLVEIPLLYETQGERECDSVAVVGCSDATQRFRLRTRRGYSDALSEQIRVAQMSGSEKCLRSDHFIWNDCSLSCLTRQARLYSVWLRDRFC
jgi:dephospho-CoA kinase